MSFDLVVALPTVEPVTVNVICLNCSITISGKEYFIDLVCLPLTQLDVILGMNWLSSNDILLDCSNKTLVFPNSEVSGLITANQANASLKEGAQGYMLFALLKTER